MRKQVAKALTVFGFLIAMVMVTVGSAQAQSLANRIKVQIPFDFQVAEKTLPAGEYSISRPADYSSDNVVMISSADGRRVVVRLTNAVHTFEPTHKARLVFHRYGDENFLFQVWPAGANTGRVLIKSHSEREAANKVQELSQTGTKRIEILKITVTAQ